MHDAVSIEILIVDDEPFLLEYMCEALSTGGFEVLAASSGAAALQFLAAEPERFGLVVSDVWMPEMDGLQLVSELQARWPSLPVLLVTASPAQEMLSGPWPVLQKPFRAAMLIAAVQAALGGR
jgi:CheY-like chemotaxis protein